MELIYFNLGWMSVNVILAFLGVMFGWLFLMIRKPIFKILAGIFWILFLPNTIYLLTDLQYLREQFFRIDLNFKLLLVLQYAFLVFYGLLSFIVGIWPLEKFIDGLKIKDRKSLAIILLLILNFAVALGVVMGKELRTHSWYVFTDAQRVISNLKTVLTTREYIIFTISWGVMNNLIYFLFNRKIAKLLNVKFRG